MDEGTDCITKSLILDVGRLFTTLKTQISVFFYIAQVEIFHGPYFWSLFPLWIWVYNLSLCWNEEDNTQTMSFNLVYFRLHSVIDSEYQPVFICLFGLPVGLS